MIIKILENIIHIPNHLENIIKTHTWKNDKNRMQIKSWWELKDNGEIYKDFECLKCGLMLLETELPSMDGEIYHKQISHYDFEVNFNGHLTCEEVQLLQIIK